MFLKRKVGTKLYMKMPDGRQIVVSVESTHRGQATIGIDAPADVLIARDELVRQKPAGWVLTPDDAATASETVTANRPHRDDVTHPQHPALDLLS